MPAKRQGVTSAANTYANERLIGRRFEDQEVKKNVKTDFRCIVRGSNGDTWVKGSDGKVLSPSQIRYGAMMKLKETAECYLDTPVRYLFMEVPVPAYVIDSQRRAYFNDSQRQTPEEAGQIAWLNG